MRYYKRPKQQPANERLDIYTAKQMILKCTYTIFVKDGGIIRCGNEWYKLRNSGYKPKWYSRKQNKGDIYAFVYDKLRRRNKVIRVSWFTHMVKPEIEIITNLPKGACYPRELFTKPKAYEIGDFKY